MSKKKQPSSEDYGFSKESEIEVNRFINEKGNFNVIRKGGKFQFKDIYHWLLNIHWRSFWALAFGSILLSNVLFALLYFRIGPTAISGVKTGSEMGTFLDCLFFSFQTFTTVGYGAMAPQSVTISLIASFEAVFGLIVFALVTALIYAKFSKPSINLLFSKHMLISPHKNGEALMFRIVNQRPDVMIEVDVKVVLAINSHKKGKYQKEYLLLPLEREHVMFFPLNWTLVHPINDKSPLKEMLKKGFSHYSMEFMIQVKSFDSTYSQTVYRHHSYLCKDVIRNAKFERMYHTNAYGDIELDLDKLNVFQKTEG